MNSFDKITGSTAATDSLDVTLINASGAPIGAGAEGTAQVNKLSIQSVTADVAQVNRYTFDSAGSAATNTFTYGGNNGAYTYSATSAPTSATNFAAALNAVAGSTIAATNSVATTGAVAVGALTTMTVASATGLRVGQSVSGTGVDAETFISAISGTTVTLSVAATGAIAAGTAIAFGQNEVIVTAPVAGTPTPSISFGSTANLTQALVTANVAGNQGDLVSFTYNGLTGTYAIGASVDATASNLRDALTATIPASQAVATLIVVAGADNDYVTLTSATKGVPLASLTFSGVASDIPVMTTTTANVSASGAISFGSVQNVEILNLTNTSGSKATVSQTAIASAKQLWSDNSTNDLVWTEVGKTTTLGINGNGTSTQLGGVAGTYVAETTGANLAVSGGAKAGAVSLTAADNQMTSATISSSGGAQSATAGQVNTLNGLTLSGSTQLKTLNINAATSLTTGDIASDLTAINASGAATTVNIGALEDHVKTVNASGLTAGGVTATLNTGAVKDFSFIGGAGKDTLTVTGAFSNAVGAIDGGGATNDTIVITNSALASTTGAKFKNFEVLDNKVVGSAQDASVVTGITSLITNADGAGFTKMTAAQAANVVVRNQVSTTGGAVNAATFSLGNSSGTADVLGLTLQNATAATASTVVNPGALTVAGFETLNLTVNAGVTSIYSSGTTLQAATSGVAFSNATGAVGDLKAINVSGAYAATVNLTNATEATSLDASANTAGTILTTGGQTGALLVKGSATAANDITLGSIGSGGTLSVTAGSAADVIRGTQAVIAAATISGGAGSDTLVITDTGNLTVADATFKNVSEIEKFQLGTTTGALSWVAGTNVKSLVEAAGGVWDVKAAGITTGSVTLDASVLGGTNSLKADLTVSAGATVVANSVTQVNIISSTGGADDIKVTTVAATTGSTGNIRVDASGNTSAGVKIDGSKIADDLTSSATINLIGGTGKDTITGGALADTITGGAGQDLLTGGAARDTFVYVTKAATVGKVNVDLITDFKAGDTAGVTDADLVAIKQGAGTMFTGITIDVSTTKTIGTAVTSTSTVSSIDDVYAAVSSDTAFAVSNFVASNGTNSGGIQAKTIYFASGSAAGTYLVINDAVAGFQEVGDVVIRLDDAALGTAFHTTNLVFIS